VQIVAEHRIKKGTAGRQAVLPHKADAQKKLTTENMKVGVGVGRCHRGWGQNAK